MVLMLPLELILRHVIILVRELEIVNGCVFGIIGRKIDVLR